MIEELFVGAQYDTRGWLHLVFYTLITMHESEFDVGESVWFPKDVESIEVTAMRVELNHYWTPS